MKLSDIASKTSELAVDIDGVGTLHVQYRTNGYTYGTALDSKTQLAKARTEEDKEKIITKALISLIQGWDLEEDDGSPSPIDEATIAKLPMPIVGAIFEELIKTMASVHVPEAKGASSQEQ